MNILKLSLVGLSALFTTAALDFNKAHANGSSILVATQAAKNKEERKGQIERAHIARQRLEVLYSQPNVTAQAFQDAVTNVSLRDDKWRHDVHLPEFHKHAFAFAYMRRRFNS